MKIRNIFKTALLAVLALGAASCAEKEFAEVTDLGLARCLQPQNLAARVNSAVGDEVTFSWDVNKDADGYELILYTDEEMFLKDRTLNVMPGEVPYTIRLTADQKYWFTVQAYRVNADGEKDDTTLSNLAVFDGSVKTFAVKDNLFPEIVARTETSVSFVWSKDLSDYTEVTELRAAPVKGGQTVKKTISSAEATAAAATIEGLEPATEYQFTLFYMSASRGAIDSWTRSDKGNAATISDEAGLKAALLAGGEYYLTQAGGPYNVSDVKPAGSIVLKGEQAGDGSKPVVIARFLVDDMPAGSSLYFESVTFNGNADKSRLVERSADVAVSLSSIKVVNCDITNYKAGLFYEGDKAGNAFSVDEVVFDGCSIFDILGSGGDAFDIRKNGQVGSVVFNNNTIYDGMRTLFRIDQVDANKLGKVEFTNNTVKNICTVNDSNNRGLFAFYVPVEFTLKNNLFLYEDGGKKDETVVDYTQLVQDNSKTVVPTIIASDNYVFATGKDFFKRVSAPEAGCTVMNADPCYNSKGNFFQLAADDLIDKKVGASKWWIPYAEKAEDLTQGVIEGAHTWNLQNATLFAGEVKNSRVRDNLMLVGTEATPINADGGINFLSAAQLNRKGVPTEGFISFIVNKPGSVDILLEDGAKTGSGVVVALLDDNGLAVQGGAAASSAGVQKILVPKVAGEGTIYIYPNGAVSVTKLAWSEDTEGGNSVLATPRLTVEPVTVKEGEETEVTVSWEAVANAASYELKFNKRHVELEDGALSYTVPAETIAAMDAGLYNFTIQAFPSEDDIYYKKSEIGTAAIAIQPKGGEEVTEKSIVWDFTAEYASDINVSDSKVYKYEAGAVEEVAAATSEDVLYFSPNAKAIKHSKLDCTADGVTYHPITYGGGAAYMFFRTSKAGKLIVTASNGKSKADAVDCKLDIKINGTASGLAVDLQPYDVDVAGVDAKVYEWDITNGDGSVQEIQIIKPSGKNSPFIYKVEFVYKEAASAPAPIKWNFTAEYASDINVADSKVYKYEAGAVEEVAAATSENVLYFSPNSKAIKHSKLDCTADGVTYHPITYGGGAAYMFFRTSKAGKLIVTASNGKSKADAVDCKLDIKINGTASGLAVDLQPYDVAIAGVDAKVYEWDITNGDGSVQEIQIFKPSGKNSPFIYEVVFQAK